MKIRAVGTGDKSLPNGGRDPRVSGPDEEEHEDRRESYHTH